MRTLLMVTALSLASLAPAAAAEAGKPVALVAHRAVYDLTLLRAEGSRGLSSARGRIAMDFGGDACDGYTMKYRQVTVLDSNETGARTLDTQTATFETGDGSSMRFRSVSTIGGRGDSVDGNAKLRPDGTLDVSLRQPKRASFSADSAAVFPTEHLKRIIEAARRGETSLAVKVYDGSDDGRKIYDTFSVIGRRIAPGTGDNLEPAAHQAVLADVPRWPVTVSYYAAGRADRTPAYTVSFELYENGISRNLKLDYGEFVLKGDLQVLQVQKQAPCQR